MTIADPSHPQEASDWIVVTEPPLPIAQGTAHNKRNGM